MFILRRFLPYGTEENTELGDYYRLVSRRTSPKDFDLFAKENSLADEVYAVVVFEPTMHTGTLNETYMPLVDGVVAYIMNEKGQTFARIN